MRAAFFAFILLSAACHREPIRAEPEPAEPVQTPDRDLAVRPAIALTVDREPSPVVAKVGICKPGQRKACFGGRGLPRPADADDDDYRGPYMPCLLDKNDVPYWYRGPCNTPLVVAFDDAPVRFTRPEADFTIGSSMRTEWVGAETPWLALDRDGSGCIDSARELFAGFAELRALDANGDGILDRRDPAFAELVLWSDANQDKVCTPNELSKLTVDELPLDAVTMPWTGRSVEGEIARLPSGGRISDVFLAPM